MYDHVMSIDAIINSTITSVDSVVVGSPTSVVSLPRVHSSYTVAIYLGLARSGRQDRAVTAAPAFHSL